MLAWFTDISVGLFDLLLGWLLHLPGDVRLFGVALLTSLMLIGVRRVTTNQDVLRRAAADRKRLRTLIRQARRRKNGTDPATGRSAVKRMKATRSMIAMKTLKYELLPLAAAILPIAMLATWAFERLAYHPPKVGEPVVVAAYTPVSAIGEPMHLTPADRLSADGWVTMVRPDPAPDGSVVNGIATWTLRAEGPTEATLAMHLRGRTVRRPVCVGKPTYAPTLTAEGEIVTETRLRPLKLFGVVPGIEAIYLAPWIVGYLILVIPLAWALKRILHVY